jgi:hypothetical protein
MNFLHIFCFVLSTKMRYGSKKMSLNQMKYPWEIGPGSEGVPYAQSFFRRRNPTKTRGLLVPGP